MIRTPFVSKCHTVCYLPVLNAINAAVCASVADEARHSTYIFLSLRFSASFLLCFQSSNLSLIQFPNRSAKDDGGGGGGGGGYQYSLRVPSASFAIWQ
jgi:hypothetical protein